MIPTSRAIRSVKFFILSILLLLLQTKHVTAQLPTRPTFFQVGCYNTTGNFTQNSAYHNNLKLVLSDLLSQASAGLPFYSTSVGALSTDAAVYGLYYCRGDISPQLCSDCVKAATQNSLDGGSCFPIKEAVIWYEECTLRYSNVPKVGLMEDRPKSWWNSTTNVSDPSAFLQLLNNNIKSIIHKAAYGNGSSLGFATGREEVTPMETLYSLVQCRLDINGSSCESCLQTMYRYIRVCCSYTVEWVYVFSPSCQLRFGLSPFYFTATTLPPPPPPPSSPSPPNHPPGTFVNILLLHFT